MSVRIAALPGVELYYRDQGQQREALMLAPSPLVSGFELPGGAGC